MRLIILTLALATIAPAQTTLHARRIGDDQPLPYRVARMPPHERRLITSQIEANVIQREAADPIEGPETNDAERRTDAKAIASNLRYLRIRSTAGPLLIVQGYDTDACGAVGNCQVWILDGNGRLLLQGAGGDELSILSTSHHHLPDILLRSHNSSAEHDLTWYRFNDRRYKAARCATRYDEAPPLQPKGHTDFAPCKN